MPTRRKRARPFGAELFFAADFADRVAGAFGSGAAPLAAIPPTVFWA